MSKNAKSPLKQAKTAAQSPPHKIIAPQYRNVMFEKRIRRGFYFSRKTQSKQSNPNQNTSTQNSELKKSKNEASKNKAKVIS